MVEVRLRIDREALEFHVAQSFHFVGRGGKKNKKRKENEEVAGGWKLNKFTAS